MNRFEEADSVDVVVNAIRSIKTYIPKKIKEVENYKIADTLSKTEQEKQMIHKDGYIRCLQDLGIYVKSLGV